MKEAAGDVITPRRASSLTLRLAKWRMGSHRHETMERLRLTVMAQKLDG